MTRIILSNQLNIIISGITTNGYLGTTPNHSIEGGVKTGPEITLEAALKTIRMYFDIFGKFDWENQILVLFQIVV